MIIIIKNKIYIVLHISFLMNIVIKLSKKLIFSYPVGCHHHFKKSKKRADEMCVLKGVSYHYIVAYMFYSLHVPEYRYISVVVYFGCLTFKITKCILFIFFPYWCKKKKSLLFSILNRCADLEVETSILFNTHHESTSIKFENLLQE